LYLGPVQDLMIQKNVHEAIIKTLYEPAEYLAVYEQTALRRKIGLLHGLSTNSTP